jgi:DnaD/phage-associated family protein
MSGGQWIKLHRKFLNWEWWEDANVARLFLYCLLKANFEDAKWQGITVKRGSFVTSYAKMEAGTGLSKSQLETAINKLISTGELKKKIGSRYTLITICNYNVYQTYTKEESEVNKKQIGSEIRNESEANRKQIGTSKKNKEIKKNKEEKDISNCSSNSDTMNFYTGNFGMINSFIAQDICKWEETLNSELVLEAMKKALGQNKRNWNYVNGILKNWLNSNVKTIEDVEALETEFMNSQQKRQLARKPYNTKKEITPKWMNKPYQEFEETEEMKKRRKELEEWLKIK